MRKILTGVATAVALAGGVAAASATTGSDGNGSARGPQCVPTVEHNDWVSTQPRPPRCPPVTVTVTGPTTTSTVTTTQTVTAPAVTVTAPAVTPPPTVIVQPAGPTTVNVTVTVNGVPTTVTVPGNVAGTLPRCVVTLRSAVLGPLPRQFHAGLGVSITSNGHTQRGVVMSGRRVRVNLTNLPCGVYPISVTHGKLRPAWRIWSLTGGNRLTRFWFPGLPGVSTF